MFEWAPGIPILYDTQEETPYIIDGDELDVENVAIDNYDNGPEEDEDEQGLNITEKNQEPVNEELIFITGEEDNNEVDNTDIENNEDENVMNEINDGISAAE